MVNVYASSASCAILIFKVHLASEASHSMQLHCSRTQPWVALVNCSVNNSFPTLQTRREFFLFRTFHTPTKTWGCSSNMQNSVVYLVINRTHRVAPVIRPAGRRNYFKRSPIGIAE